ncbi:GntR family transcriptional regulator [Streptomyces sp. 5-10]|nr:GntR family transcriptional regulator [Streptomyces sp. 5-10]
MNSDEARQLFEVRLSLDPTAAELAATRRTDDDIAALRAAVDNLLPVTRQWGEEALTAHRTFHQALYRASHNDILIRLLDDLWDKSDRHRHQRPRRPRKPPAPLTRERSAQGRSAHVRLTHVRLAHVGLTHVRRRGLPALSWALWARATCRGSSRRRPSPRSMTFCRDACADRAVGCPRRSGPE